MLQGLAVRARGALDMETKSELYKLVLGFADLGVGPSSGLAWSTVMDLVGFLMEWLV